MSATETDAIDFRALLSPVAPGSPAGESLRYEGTHDRIREARREDDPRLSQGIYQSDPKRADWAEVESLCISALARSKDLQIAAWLLEARLHRRGFAGALEGLRLLCELCEHFWDDLHPALEPGGDAGARVAPVEWVNEKLSLKLKRLPLTAPQSADAAAYSFADWESACELDHLAKKDPKAALTAEARGRVSLSKFSTSVMLTEARHFAELYEETSDAADEAGRLERLLDARCGRQAPTLHAFREALFAVRQAAADVLQQRPDAAEFVADPDGGDEMTYAVDEEDSDEVGGRLWSSAPIRSRAEAYQRLSEAADYLLRTEPHSPTPYLVRRAVEWGGMSLQEVLRQIVRNDGEMQEIDRLLRLTAAGDPRK